MVREDEALARYESGIRLLAQCHTLLDTADRKVALLTGVDSQGQATTSPFDSSATIDREPIAGKIPIVATEKEKLDDLPF